MKNICFILMMLTFSQHLIAKNTESKRITNHVKLVSPSYNNLSDFGWANGLINTMVLETDSGLVLFGAQNTPHNARLVRADVEGSSEHDMVKLLINCHGHVVQTGGNSVFDDCEILAQENCEQEMIIFDDLFRSESVFGIETVVQKQQNIADTFKVENLAQKKVLERGAKLKSLQEQILEAEVLVFPIKTFSEQIEIEFGGTLIQLMYMGSGYGKADIITFLPSENLLYMANCFHLGVYSKTAMPTFYQGRKNDIEHWIATLNYVLELDDKIKYIAATHTQDLYKRRDLEFILAYCQEIQEKIEAVGSSFYDLKKLEDIDSFDSLFKRFNDVIRVNREIEMMHKKNMSILLSNV